MRCTLCGCFVASSYAHTLNYKNKEALCAYNWKKNLQKLILCRVCQGMIAQVHYHTIERQQKETEGTHFIVLISIPFTSPLLHEINFFRKLFPGIYYFLRDLKHRNWTINKQWPLSTSKTPGYFSSNSPRGTHTFCVLPHTLSAHPCTCDTNFHDLLLLIFFLCMDLIDYRWP